MSAATLSALRTVSTSARSRALRTLRALAKRTDDRYQSAAAMKAAWVWQTPFGLPVVPEV